MVKIFKTYSVEKERTTPILSVDGKALGFLAYEDARHIAYLCLPIESVRYSDGGNGRRYFHLVSYKGELFQLGWISKQIGSTIKVATRAGFEALVDQYDHDPRWTRIGE